MRTACMMLFWSVLQQAHTLAAAYLLVPTSTDLHCRLLTYLSVCLPAWTYLPTRRPSRGDQPRPPARPRRFHEHIPAYRRNA